MNDYERRQDERRQRFQDRAAKAQQEAAQRHQAAHDAVKDIPFGQPILVGHHSEGRHRAALKRADQNMGKAVAASDKAEHYARRAAGVGTGGISSDDPEAVEKLREKLAGLQQVQEAMKAANLIYRKKGLTDEEKLERLAGIPGLSPKSAAEGLKPDFCGRIGFPDYALQNNNANIKRVRERIATLEKEAARRAALAEAPSPKTEYQGFSVVEDLEENRLLIVFAGIPSPDARELLKGHGWRWSPTRRAWSRQLNANARATFRHWIREKLEALC